MSVADMCYARHYFVRSVIYPDIPVHSIGNSVKCNALPIWGVHGLVPVAGLRQYIARSIAASFDQTCAGKGFIQERTAAHRIVGDTKSGSVDPVRKHYRFASK